MGVDRLGLVASTSLDTGSSLPPKRFGRGLGAAARVFPAAGVVLGLMSINRPDRRPGAVEAKLSMALALGALGPTTVVGSVAATGSWAGDSLGCDTGSATVGSDSASTGATGGALGSLGCAWVSSMLSTA